MLGYLLPVMITGTGYKVGRALLDEKANKGL